MSLVTVLRSPSSESASWATDSEVDEDQEDSSCRSRASSFEGFFASKGAAYALPDGDFARRATKHGGEMQLHLQAMVNLLRDEDVLRLVVKLESQYPNKIRYLTVVSAFGPNDEEESIIMGVDWTDKATIGLVVPLYRDTTIRLDGDGGFKLISAEKSHDLKPVSVQTMWTALQWIHKCADNARRHNYYPTGLSHTWISYYVTKITSDRLCLNEWNQMDDLWSKRKELPLDISPEKELIMKLIRHKLREVMLKVDLEEVTSRQVRNMLEEDTQMELKEYREFVDEEMMTILGQMDSASKIFDHVFLGSEWNASNLEELKENGVGFILNITREIDNFFPGTFSYYNIRVWDMDETELLHHWDNTYKFIQKAKDAGSKVLVHCKMGISRSASTVIAYGMKEYGWSLGDTVKYVKARRSCVQPNAGFWKQLITYEGILNSSKQRYNKLFSDRRAQSDSSDAEKRSKRVKKTAKKTKKKYNTIGYSPAGASEQTKSEPVQSEGVDVVDIGTDSESVPLKSESSSEGSEGESEEDRVASEDDGDDVFFPEAVSGDKREPEVVPSTSTPYVAHTAPLVEETEEASEEAVESLPPVSGIRSAEKSSLYRVSSVPILVSGGHTRTQQELALKDPGNFRRTSSLRERGRIKADGLRSLTAGKSASAENIRECSAEDKGIVQSEEARICADAPGTAAEKNVQVSGNEAEIPSAEEIVLETESAETESAGEEISDGGIKTETVEHLNLASSLPRDLLGVMESGFVKRHSRNFEEGIFNLPLQIEPIDDGVGLTEEESEVDVLPPVGDNKPEPEVESSPGEEPEPGVVKKHKEGFEMKHRETMKKQLSLQRSSSGEGTGRSGVEGGLDTPWLPGQGDGEDLFQAKDSETLAADPGLQRESEDVDSVSVSVEALIQKVNEDMKKEVSSRRTSQSKKEQEVRALVDKAVGQMEESVAEVGDEDSTEDGGGERVTLRQKKDESESHEVPVVGLVKRNTLILEGKARDLLLLEVQPGDPVVSKGEATSAVLTEKDKTQSCVEHGMNTTVEPSGVEIDQGSAVSEEASKSSEEKEDKESEQDTENVPQKGLVKRHTLLIEERLQPLEQEENKAEKEEEETGVEGTSEKTCVSGEDGGPRYQIELTCDDRDEVTVAVEEDPEALAGLVKREKLRIEERLQPVVADPNQQELLVIDDVAELEADVSVEEGGRQELNEASQEDKDGTESQDDKETEVGVDTSSVVKVKEHAQHLESVLREGLTTESKGVKRQKSSEEETRGDDAAPKVVIIPRSLSMERADEGNDCTTAGTHAHTDDTMESLSDSAVSLALQKAQDNLDPEQEKPDNWETGNVKQRTQILEEIIRDRDEDGEKKGNSVRRHESMPKTIRPPEKFVLRRRSVSDITENNSGGSRRDVVYTVQRIKDCSAESTSSSSLPRDWSPLQDKPEETNIEKEKLKADEFSPEIYCEGEVKDKTHIQLFECLDNSRESSLSVKEKIQIMDSKNHRNMTNIN